MITSASKIVQLSKLGVSVTSENAKLLVKYLSDVENLNDDDIPVQKSTSKLGWIGQDFIPYDTDIIFDGDMQFKQLYESIGSYGNKQMWMDHVLELRKSGRMEIKFFLAASFASVLVGMTGALPFIVDLWGETEGGKSVAMMLAASIWANPADSMYIGDFKTTDVQLEVRSDLLNHLPLMLDDSSKVSARIRDNFEGVGLRSLLREREEPLQQRTGNPKREPVEECNFDQRGASVKFVCDAGRSHQPNPGSGM